MGDIKIIAYILLLLLDFSIVTSLRTAMFECFQSNGYKKTYRKINIKQSFIDRITLNYISPFLKKYRREFSVIHKIYKIYLLVSPCLSLLILFAYVFFVDGIYFIVSAITCSAKLLLAFIIRIKLFPYGEVAANSIFISKKRKK